MTKKLYIIDWDETIPKIKTGGLVLSNEHTKEYIKKNIREFSRIKKLLKKINSDKHVVVFVGRKQIVKTTQPINDTSPLKKDVFPTNEDLSQKDDVLPINERLALLYADVLLGKKNLFGKEREFLTEKDIYLYGGDGPTQSQIIDDIILRFNRENKNEDYLPPADYKDRVVIVGNKQTYAADYKDRIISQGNKQTYAKISDTFRVIETDDERSYLSELSKDLEQSVDIDIFSKEVAETKPQSFWQKHKTKITVAGIPTTMVLSILLVLTLVLTSVIFPPGGLVGGIFLGAGIGLGLGSLGFGLPWCWSRKHDPAQSIPSFSNSFTTSLSHLLNRSVNEDPNEETHLLDIFKPKKADPTLIKRDDEIQDVPTHKSPINFRGSLGAGTKLEVDKVNSQEPSSVDKQEKHEEETFSPN